MVCARFKIGSLDWDSALGFTRANYIIGHIIMFYSRACVFSKAYLDKLNIEMLPEYLGEAIEYFVKDPVITNALGSYLTKRARS